MHYYIHLMAFPHENRLSETFFEEIKGIITWYLTGMNLLLSLSIVSYVLLMQ